MSNQNEAALLDSLLDATLDDLADIPEFAIFPIGLHRVNVNLKLKQIGTHPAVEADFTYVDVVELADANDKVPDAGAKASCAYMLDNEFGQGAFKRMSKPISEMLGITKLRDLIEATKDITCLVLVKHRKDKKDATKLYMEVSELFIE